ncbi:MAG: phosphatidate cytidylyltransferase [Woeseia sp.]
MLKQRALTAVIALGALFVVLYVLPPVMAKAVIAALMLAGAWEWAAFLGPKTKMTRLVFVGLIAVLLGVASVSVADEFTVGIVLKIALAWWVTALFWTFFFPTPIPKPAGWVCGALVLIPAYLSIILLYSLQPALLLFVLVIVWVADIGAYFTGRHIGKVQLAPKISPGKTWEGVLGGLFAVAVLALIQARWLDIDIAMLLPFCLAVAIISIIGDLTVSMFKRNAGIKDSGRLFPGHGGVLDRIDSVTAAAPLFVIGVSQVGLT